MLCFSLVFKFSPRVRFISTSSSLLATENYYQILGLKSSASQKDVRSAYLDLCKKHHPDKNPSANAVRFQKINEAYNCLSKVNARSKYDSDLRYGAGQYNNRSYPSASSRAYSGAQYQSPYRSPHDQKYYSDAYYRQRYTYRPSPDAFSKREKQFFSNVFIVMTTFFMAAVIVLQVRLFVLHHENRAKERSIEYWDKHFENFGHMPLDIRRRGSYEQTKNDPEDSLKDK